MFAYNDQRVFCYFMQVNSMDIVLNISNTAHELKELSSLFLKPNFNEINLKSSPTVLPVIT